MDNQPKYFGGEVVEWLIDPLPALPSEAEFFAEKERIKLEKKELKKQQKNFTIEELAARNLEQKRMEDELKADLPF